MKQEFESNFIGWVLYDGECGMCSHFAGINRKRLAGIKIGFMPFQTEGILQKFNIQLSDAQLEMYLVLKDGEIFKGAEAYRFCLKRLPWLYPLYFISILPGFRQIFDWTYRKVAQNRQGISKICRFEKPQSS